LEINEAAMKKYLVASLFLFASVIFSQKDFEEWKKQQNQEYQKFKTEQDKQFAEYLKKNWVKGDVNAYSQTKNFAKTKG
jgi:hypothetical protein